VELVNDRFTPHLRNRSAEILEKRWAIGGSVARAAIAGSTADRHRSPTGLCASRTMEADERNSDLLDATVGFRILRTSGRTSTVIATVEIDTEPGPEGDSQLVRNACTLRLPHCRHFSRLTNAAIGASGFSP
jgi:hypothetical protein